MEDYVYLELDFESQFETDESFSDTNELVIEVYNNIKEIDLFTLMVIIQSAFYSCNLDQIKIMLDHLSDLVCSLLDESIYKVYYNELMAYYCLLNDNTQAYNHMLKAYDLCNEFHKDHLQLVGQVICNLVYVLIHFEKYQEAIDRSLDYLSLQTDIMSEHYLCIIHFLITIYCKLNNKEKCYYYLDIYKESILAYEEGLTRNVMIVHYVEHLIDLNEERAALEFENKYLNLNK